MKYNKKQYIVRDLKCKRYVDTCFVPFSGNGINICRRWELGQCPDPDDCETELRLYKKNKKIV